MNDEIFHLTPVDVRRYEFGTQMRGYEKARVDQFREQVADELERLTRSNQDLEAKARGFHEQLRAFRERDKALNEALISAQQMRQDTKEQAEREAGLIVREARVEADRMIEAAKVEVRKLERQADALERLRKVTEAKGHVMAPRLTVHPEYVLDPERWLHPSVRFAVLDRSDAEGLGRDDPGSVWPERVSAADVVQDGAEVVLVGHRSTQWYSGASERQETHVLPPRTARAMRDRKPRTALPSDAPSVQHQVGPVGGFELCSAQQYCAGRQAGGVLLSPCRRCLSWRRTPPAPVDQAGEHRQLPRAGAKSLSIGG